MTESVSLREHAAAIRECDAALAAERDRRYTEVASARAEALKIKEAGDAKALDLAREIQTYKDEKANELREQISSERGLYATKDDLAPVLAFMASQTGNTAGVKSSVAALVQAISSVATLIGMAFLILGR